LVVATAVAGLKGAYSILMGDFMQNFYPSQLQGLTV